MARFCDIEDGTRAIKVIDLPLANVPHCLQTGTEEQAKERELNPNAYRVIKVGVRALLACEREKVLELATARAKSKGGEPTSGNGLFDHALAIYTTAAAYVDPDTPPGQDAKLFFGDTIEGAAEKLRTSRHITDDIVFYLREQQEIWQDQINPQALTLAADQLWEATQKAADEKGHADFLRLMRPGTLLRFTHILAAQCVNLLADRLLPSTTETSPTSDS
jgi:hypothetical protein